MNPSRRMDRIAINIRCHELLGKLLDENPVLGDILRTSRNHHEVQRRIRRWVRKSLKSSPHALKVQQSKHLRPERVASLEWWEYAAIRLLDYLDHSGREFVDPDFRDETVVTDPFRLLWLAVSRGTGGASPPFFRDMIMLFRQLAGKLEHRIPSHEEVEDWMLQHASGLDRRIVRNRGRNRDRILKLIIDRIDRGLIQSRRFQFGRGQTPEQKLEKAREWWEDHRFHLKFAIRDPDLLNEMLDRSLRPETMQILYQAQERGIPFFVNPYYLSLINIAEPTFAVGSDLAIRTYVIYSRQLVKEFGHIRAWEREDEVEPGKPNAAGWLLPSKRNVHRRYPDVAILIPETMGRACGGLCVSCQRMYDFQSGHLNFNLDRLRPAGSWPDRLERLMKYFEEDTQLRDILITGGDALMSSDRSLRQILDAVLRMAIRKRRANSSRKSGDKYAELVRVRLGTRLPVYLPQRITPELAELLAGFKREATKAGVRQFVIQTHFVSAMEVTPEVRVAISRLLSAGWIINNQQVFTAAASRRGHTARLRQVLNDVGVLPYYTFSVKGYTENQENFATNARIVQEQVEEKSAGTVPPSFNDAIRRLPMESGNLVKAIDRIRKEAKVPFLATDRSVINLPGVGKSLTFRVIGITRHGRRIIEFDHDPTRAHSPIIREMGKVEIVESDNISGYLDQMRAMGEDPVEYESIWGYSIGLTEPRMSIYEYPEYEYKVTSRLSNIQLADKKPKNRSS